MKLIANKFSQHGTGIFYTDNPAEAVEGCDVVVTDTWVSMGVESEKEARLKSFAGYQVTESVRIIFLM